jgi:hypothetical protein
MEKETARKQALLRGATMRAVKGDPLFSFLFLLAGRSLSRLGFGQPLLVFVHTTGGIHEFLSPSVEWVASIADPDQNYGTSRLRFNHIAASATNFRILVFRMNFSFHKQKGRTA